MKKLFCILAIVALGLTACDTNISPEPIRQQVYHFSIPVSIGSDAGTKAVEFDGTSGITSKLLESDKIYVYNVTKNAWARTGNGGEGYGYLQPSALENEGMSCTLTGDLSFYTRDPNHYYWEEVTELDATDTYNLYYQAKVDNDKLVFDYTNSQEGSQASVSSLDYARALGVTISLSDNTLSADGRVQFKNYGSLFRQRLSFSGTENAPTSLRYLKIKRESGGKLISTNYLCSRIDSEDVISVFGNSSIMDGNGDVYFALAVDESDPPTGDLIFEAADFNGNYFTGSKALPASGLKNGKYYYGNLELAYNSHRKIPVVTDSNGDPVWPNMNDEYLLGNGAIISGDSDGFICETKPSVTVTLTGNGTANFAGGGPFLISYFYDLTVNLASNYTINCPNATEAICSARNLRLKTSGGTYTLTVTTKPYSFGLCGASNYNYNYNPYPSSLAADANTTVSLTSDTDNGDGTHTYVYTVTTTHPVSLADVTTTDSKGVKYYAAQNGDIISGSFVDSEGYITIADGATVTLNLSPHFSAPSSCDHAPIHCMGDAHIILAADSYNRVTAGSRSEYPAVFVSSGKTLTISGTGELVANAGYSSGAGIGGGDGHNCGNIVITGGVISAYGSSESAAIGSSSFSSCGNITISGGAIKVAKYQGVGESHGAGIGTGASGSCGDITISGGQIGGNIGGYDGAVAGKDAAGIGSGLSGSCGTITIGADITYVRVSSNSDSDHHPIGGKWPNSCDVYFGNFKVYDKTTGAWYNSSTGTYDENLPSDGNYGGLTFINYYYTWILTPVTP